MLQRKLKLTPMMILKRGRFFYFFFHWLYEIVADFCLSGMLLNRTIYNEDQGAYPAQSISYLYLREMVKAVELKVNDVFVDVGCAWGRLLGYMRRHTNAKKYIGIELNLAIAAKAKEIFQNMQNVEIIAGNVLDNFPMEGTVFFLFNPFDAEMMDSFLSLIEKSIIHKLRLYYLHPTCRHVFDERPQHWKLQEEIDLKPAHLGALTLCVYEYNA